MNALCGLRSAVCGLRRFGYYRAMSVVASGLRSVLANRYVTLLREGGSLPAIMEADDDGLYVVKFRGAGQGPKALLAELLAGEIGRAIGLYEWNSTLERTKGRFRTGARCR
jgi:hypothetical protein